MPTPQTEYRTTAIPVNPRVKNVQGRCFGRLRVVSCLGINAKHQVDWLCFCDCGKPVVASTRVLLSGNTKSCGCWRRDALLVANTTHGQAKRSGFSGAYMSWRAMLDRCLNPKGDFWNSYGGRGITFCSEWKIFENFFAAMGPRPAGKSLDRIDVNGNYEKGNCQWATPRQQANNKRIKKNNKTGVEGVSIVDDGDYHYYRARATVDGKRVALGCYELSPSGFKAAVEAVKKAKQLAEVLL